MLEELKCPNCASQLRIIADPTFLLVCDFCLSQYILHRTENSIDLFKQKLIGKDELFEESAKLACKYGKISQSILERQLYVDKLRAFKIIDELIESAIITEKDYEFICDLRIRYEMHHPEFKINTNISPLVMKAVNKPRGFHPYDILKYNLKYEPSFANELQEGDVIELPVNHPDYNTVLATTGQDKVCVMKRRDDGWLLARTPRHIDGGQSFHVLQINDYANDYYEKGFNSYFIKGISQKENSIELIYFTDKVIVAFKDENLLKEEYEKAINIIKLCRDKSHMRNANI